jgi:hypothetical protein
MAAVNLTHPELAELSNPVLPAASEDALKHMRTELCSTSGSFSLQSHQTFLRRVFSPDSPARNLLMVHGTGVGKSCSAIQIAEEYILRPEYQDKKVLVVSNPAVQANFYTEIFDMSRVKVDEKSGIFTSSQCTGRRYLDTLLRVESEPSHWKDQATRDRLAKMAGKLIDEFYEFSGYITFGELLNKNADDDDWISRTFDNRLVLIDEAHNVRRGVGAVGQKGKTISTGLEVLVKKAKGLVLVMMTATPMFDTFEEIVYYMNLFGWNDKTLDPNTEILVSDIFEADGTLKVASEERFRTWVQTYVSYVKGENPFTFPFRLPAPRLAPDDRTLDFLGRNIADVDRFKFLKLVSSEPAGEQLKVLTGSKLDEHDNEEDSRQALILPTLSVLPGRKKFPELFSNVGEQYAYIGEPFLTPEKLPEVSAKFAAVIECISRSKGIVMVYSNFVERGARLFAMALEEHGYKPARDGPFLLAGERPKGPSKGAYMILSSEVSTPDTNALLALVRSPDNANGDKVRVIITTPRVSEGVNFKYVRQIHVLDPWWNMSRIEQVVGRALRTCSHSLLNFEEQNCTVYLHIVRTPDRRECFDEYTYRTKVEAKAIKIARVRAVLAESAMDCPLQTSLNALPEAWKLLDVKQTRSENNEDVAYKLSGMLAPTFAPDLALLQCKVHPSEVDSEHVRPLSTYLDTRDELLNTLSKMFIDKPIWTREELFKKLRYPKDVIVFTLQNAIRNAFKFKDAFGRSSVLESRGDLYALGKGTLVERTTEPPPRKDYKIPFAEQKAEPVGDVPDLDALRLAYKEFPPAASQFSNTVLNGYIFDHVLSPAEQLAYLLSEKDVQFADRYKVPETGIRVLGVGKYSPPEEPLGDDRAKVMKWIAGLKTKYSEDRTLFASLRGGKFSLSKFDLKGDEPVRKAPTRRDVPVACGTGDNKKPEVLALAKYLDKRGIGIPPDIAKKNSSVWCQFTELLVREQQESPEPKIGWYTPVELEVITSS